MDKLKGPVKCRQCRKEIKTDVCVCVSCDKAFHPSCHKQHKVYNTANELVPCKGNAEVFSVKGGSSESVDTAGDGSGERGVIADEGGHTTESSLNSKIDKLYELIKEIKDEIIGKNLIKRIITEALDEEMDRVRQEVQHWRTCELRSMISEVVKEEISGIIPIMATESGAGKKKSYSGAVRNDSESVIIIKPREEEGDNSSEATKRDIKSKIDILKLGVGITKMKKVTRGAVVVGCENKIQADKLKKEAAKDLGEKYIVQEPMKKKLKIRIFDVDKEDSDNEQDFWRKVEEQNGCGQNTFDGKIVHKATNPKTKGVTMIVEVNAKTREQFLELGRVKIGWKMCRVQDYIGILRCFKCCGYYHFAKDCTKKETCGNCAGQHKTKECKNQIKKCVNCEDKIKNFKIKNLNSEHSAYDSNCPCFKREIEKQKNKIQSSL